MEIVVDCANGAVSKIAPAVLERLGPASRFCTPSPTAATSMWRAARLIPASSARQSKNAGPLGFTFDGDADRVLAADEEGRLVDGDHIMAILAADMMERRRLKQNKIAVTTYSNLGLKTALEALGAGVVETKAGDRYVLEAMLDQGLVLGGEQSGHIILLEHNTTGDGLLTCLALLDVLTRKAQPLSALARVMQAFPQILVNVKVADKGALGGNAAVQQAIQEAADMIGSRGRIFVRPSGTEPVIRVMGEGQDEKVVQQAVDRVVQSIRAELGDG